MFIYLHQFIPSKSKGVSSQAVSTLISIENVSFQVDYDKDIECTRINTPYGSLMVKETLLEIANIIDNGGIRIANVDALRSDMNVPNSEE